mmetsp:Transcript_52023/g.160283  ORF Transcript_52023/g.160283 Transcript_52023/m.160283 type:complete len:218 (-) Transcript_52023:350-1003(-)
MERRLHARDEVVGERGALPGEDGVAAGPEDDEGVQQVECAQLELRQGEHHRRPEGARHAGEVHAEVGAAVAVEAPQRVVHEEHGRRGHHLHRDVHAPPRCGRQGAHLDAEVQREHRGDDLRPLLPLGGGGEGAPHRAREVQILFHGKLGHCPRELAHDPHRLAVQSDTGGEPVGPHLPLDRGDAAAEHVGQGSGGLLAEGNDAVDVAGREPSDGGPD